MCAINMNMFILFLISKPAVGQTAVKRPAALAGAASREGLVEAIRLQLRRNNDDYTDAPGAEGTTFATFSKWRRKADMRVKGMRRAPMGGDEMENYALNEVQGRREGHSAVALSGPGRPRVTAQMRTHPKSNGSKIEKFQRFFEKNKALFKEFLSSRMAARTVASESVQRARLRDGEWPEEGASSATPPDADRLDLLPAVGGRIHYARVKGRLCHRHVLMPEGPKYDSKGRVYLRAHAELAARPYNVTRRRRLLLPKCCNCCKKSVLGCE